MITDAPVSSKIVSQTTLSLTKSYNTVWILEAGDLQILRMDMRPRINSWGSYNRNAIQVSVTPLLMSQVKETWKYSFGTSLRDILIFLNGLSLDTTEFKEQLSKLGWKVD